MSDKRELQKQIESLEKEMGQSDFWSDKEKAQARVKELQELKNELEGVGKYDKGDAVITIFSGAGGGDAEDFSRMLFSMYQKYIEDKGWNLSIVHANENDHGGFRNITFEVEGNPPSARTGGGGAYGMLKNESGVHRLVRISPFNARKQRHTSFSMVEVVPKLKEIGEFEIPEADLDFQFAKSSGPGGQNVNKRETAVRVVHTPTGIAVHVETERSQAQNKERALEILRGKLYKKLEEDRRREEQGLSISKTTEIEWGNQIRSYVLHPYKMVKDHRTGVEIRDVEAVLDGKIQEFVDAERDLAEE